MQLCRDFAASAHSFVLWVSPVDAQQLNISVSCWLQGPGRFIFLGFTLSFSIRVMIEIGRAHV